MILAWVISLLLLCSSLIVYLEQLTTLSLIEVKTIENTQEQFMSSEKNILECEQSITNLTALVENLCFIQSAGKNRWLISSISKPRIEVLVQMDEKSKLVTRLNWRQAFE
jgi:hypothetical protein